MLLSPPLTRPLLPRAIPVSGLNTGDVQAGRQFSSRRHRRSVLQLPRKSFIFVLFTINIVFIFIFTTKFYIFIVSFHCVSYG